jgi:DeoR/GlpR family transcriptional regulator of sugar metabolism
MAAVYERAVAIVDDTRLGQLGLVTSVPLSRLALVITDEVANPTVVADLQRAAAEVRLVR